MIDEKDSKSDKLLESFNQLISPKSSVNHTIIGEEYYGTKNLHDNQMHEIVNDLEANSPIHEILDTLPTKNDHSDINSVHIKAFPKKMIRQSSDPITDREKGIVSAEKSTTSSKQDLNVGSPGRAFLEFFKKGSVRMLDQFMGPSSFSPHVSFSSVHLFNCKICMENNALSDGFSFASCSNNHTFCFACMKGYTTSQINDGVIIHVCPYEHCFAKAIDSEIESLVDPDVFQKYSRFKIIKTDPDYRECSKCSRELKFIGSVKSKADCKLQCECGAVSCFLHGDAHPNETCSQYARRIRKEENASRNAVKQISRKCPSCKTDIEKNGGCNHMTCQNCQANWCWLCGRTFDNTNDHYSPTNTMGCPGGQYAPAPEFAWWSVLGDRYYHIIDNPCLRCMWNFPSQVEYIFYVILTGMTSFIMGVVFTAVLLSILPITIPMFILSRFIPSLRDSDFGQLVFLGLPMLAAGVAGGSICLAMVLIWLPVVIILTIFLPCCTPLSWCGFACYNIRPRCRDVVDFVFRPAKLMVGIVESLMNWLDAND